MYRLLVADDEIIERKVLLKTLQKNLEEQCELFQAENGREALEIYESDLEVHEEHLMVPKGVEVYEINNTVTSDFGFFSNALKVRQPLML